jgi:hypothetical protein
VGGITESEVIRDISSALSILERAGDVLWFSRLQCGKVKTEWGSWLQLCKAGTHDFIALIRAKQGNLAIIFIEAKSGVGKAQYRPSQADFKRNYSKHRDILFVLATSGAEVTRFILDNCYSRLNDVHL